VSDSGLEAMDVDLLVKICMALILLLCCAFVVLLILKRFYPALSNPSKRGLIEILEKKSDITLGTIALASVAGQKFVFLVNKSGTAIHMVNEKIDSQVESPSDA
jgi:hypothetical protein